MFERYNEKARRTIFFARYEASNYGSAYIETEHILLGLIRESRWLFNKALPNLDCDAVRGEIKPRSDKKVSTSVDLPLSDAARWVLTSAAEEADRLNDRHIGCEHLLLGLMRDLDHPAAQLLSTHGATLASLRLEIAKLPRMDAPLKIYNIPHKRFPRTAAETVELHGVRWNLEYIHERVAHLTQYSWYWQKRAWKARDMVIERGRGAMSFDLELAADGAKFELIKAGWKKDKCAICNWALFESKDDPKHGVGYTNSRDWLCTECFEKFLERPGFFSSPYPDIT